MRTKWQKEIERRLDNLEQDSGVLINRTLEPVSVEWHGDFMTIDTDGGRLTLDEASRKWLKSVMEQGESK